MKCNDICEKYGRRSVELKIGLAKHSAESPFVLIEGTTRGLKMLAELLVALAENEESCNFHINPSGAGKFHFSKKATHGLYLHRIPCKNGEAELITRAKKKPKPRPK